MCLCICHVVLSEDIECSSEPRFGLVNLTVRYGKICERERCVRCFMSRESKEGKATVRERLCHTLDIQPDIFLGGTLVEIRGRNAVTVRGGGRITVYTEEEIRLLTREGAVSIRGRRLCCSSYCKGTVSVDGRISSVSFEEADK